MSQAFTMTEIAQPSVRIADLTWYDFAERVKGDPIVFLPTGSGG